MKKPLRIALAVAVIASLAPIAMAVDVTDPGGGIPQPLVAHVISWKVILATLLSLLGL
jgi:nitrogen-specific signal transduction histidine kinase